MFKIAKITAKYISVEDRILLFAESKTGDELKLWLTARITRRLFPSIRDKLKTITSHYDSFSGNDSPIDPPKIKKPLGEKVEDTYPGTMKPGSEQETSMPVQVLVRSVTFGQKGDKFILRMNWADDKGGALMVLATKQLSAFLQIIHGQIKKTEWDIDCSPELEFSPLL